MYIDNNTENLIEQFFSKINSIELSCFKNEEYNKDQEEFFYENVRFYLFLVGLYKLEKLGYFEICSKLLRRHLSVTSYVSYLERYEECKIEINEVKKDHPKANSLPDDSLIFNLIFCSKYTLENNVEMKQCGYLINCLLDAHDIIDKNLNNLINELTFQN